jgi:protease I
MSKNESLSGRRIAVLAADGFEKVELTIPVKALRLAGADVEIVSLRSGSIRGVNLHEPASRVHVDRTLADADPADYDGLLVPGGFINPDLLRQSAEARRFVRAFEEAGKPIATLCHGPWVLASAGLVSGRTMTSWPGVRDDMVNAGAIWVDQEVVQDRNWVTSRGPQDMVPFVEAITRLFANLEPASHAVTRLESDPQRQSPPAAVIQAMRWLPRPSIRAIVGFVAAIGAGLWALNRRSYA